jgi:hypothetical protein
MASSAAMIETATINSTMVNALGSGETTGTVRFRSISDGLDEKQMVGIGYPPIPASRHGPRAMALPAA